MNTPAGIEILEIALAMERNGLRFYERLAGNGGGRAYARLVAQERQHEKMVQDALFRLGHHRRLAVWPSGYYDYVRATADHLSRAEAMVGQALQAGPIGKDVAREISIALEKDSIFLYSTMYTLAPLPGADMLRYLATAESQHLMALNGMWRSRQPRFGPVLQAALRTGPLLEVAPAIA